MNSGVDIMKQFIDEIDAAIMSRKEEIITATDGSKTTLVYSYNLLADELYKELSGRFYELMYGYEKRGYADWLKGRSCLMEKTLHKE